MLLNQARMSSSTRSEIGCFGVKTISPEVKKSSGRSASSGGEVRMMSSSVMLSISAKFARPRPGFSVERFVIVSSLSSVTAARGNNPANDATISHAIGVDDSQIPAVSDTNRNDTPFTVVPARVVPLINVSVKDQRREREVETAPLKIGLTLLYVPSETKWVIYHCIYGLS